MENQLCRLRKSIEQHLPTKGGIIKHLVLGLMVWMAAFTTQAQTLATYTFTGLAACPNNNNNVTAQPTGATFSSYTLSSAVSCLAAANEYATSNLNLTTTIDLTKYNQFTISANSGYLLTLTSFTITHRMNENNSTTWVLRSSIDNYTTNIGGGTATNTSQTPTINLPSSGFTNITTVTFRLYLIGARRSSSHWFNDNVFVSGQINQIPANPGNPTSNSPQCVSPGVTLTRSGTPGSGITWYWQTTAAGTSTTNSASTNVVTTSGTYYITARNNTSLIWSTGAGSATIAITPNVGAASFTSGSTSTRCQGAGTVTYTATAANTSGITYSLDAASITGGNAINSFTGAVTYAAGWSGTTTITASAAGCAGPQTATHTVTITATVGTPVFTAGASSTRCQGAGSVTYGATATTTTTGITYSLNAASITGGNSIVSATGAVTYVAGWSGTTIITASAAGCNGPRTSTHTVTVTPTVSAPVFTAGATSTRCQGSGLITYTATAANSTSITYTLDATSSAAGNSIISTTGAVTYTAGWSGTSTITVVAAGCNGPSASVSHTVTITPPVGTTTFTVGATSTRCQGAATISYVANATNTTGITYSLDAASVSGGNAINPTSAALTYAAGWSGTSTITASAAGCSGPTTATHTVTITPTVAAPVFALGATSTRCYASNTVTYSATATNNTGITYSLDAASNSGGNSIDAVTGTVTYVDAWSGTSLVTASAAGCNGPVTSTHTITTKPAVTVPVFAMGATSIRCKTGNQVTYSASSGNTTGITYALDGVSLSNGNTINAASGMVTWNSSWVGNSTITATAAGCNGPATQTHVVRTFDDLNSPVFALGDVSQRCQNGGSGFYTASEPNAWTITYQLDGTGISGGNTVNSSTGEVTFAGGWYGKFKIKAIATGCGGPKEREHEIETIQSVGVPVFELGATSTRCQAGALIAYKANSQNFTSLTYQLDATSLAAGNTIQSDNGDLTFAAAWSGTSIITATATGVCNSPVSSTHTVTTLAPVGFPVFNAGTSTTRCQGANTFAYTASAANSTGLSYTLDAGSRGAGNTINSATGMVTWVTGWSGTSSVTASATGCFGPNSSTHTITITPTVGTPVFAMGSNSVRCKAANAVTYSATATTNTGITYSLDGTSLGFGNIIDASTGAVIYLDNWTGTSIVTATATGCNGPVSASHSVSTTPFVVTPVFSSGATSNRCQAAGNITYSATATYSSSLVYTLDATSLAAGNTINAGTGVVTYTAAYFGTSYITATANGCGPSTSGVHTAVTAASIGAPIFMKGASSGICQGSIPVTYTASAPASTSISYSLDATSVSNGNIINTATGEVTYSPTWTGTTTVTATAQGCAGPRTANHVAQVIQTVGTPAFNLGVSSTRCQGNTTVTYTANAAGQTGMSYILDDASVAGGNTINSSTGAVTYVAAWTGTSIITATATGCSGPTTFNHTASTTPYVTTPVFDVNSISIRCQGAATLPYVATAQYSTGITYSVSGGAGVSINASTGNVTFSSAFSGSATVTASAAGCSGPRTAMFTITVTPTVGIPVFSMGASSSRCHANGTATYTATATTNTGITYSLDDASITGGNSIDAATGTVTYVDSWIGTSVITASAEGCNGPKSASHTVTSNDDVTVPVFTLAATTVRCQGAGFVTYTATANNTTGITYTLDNTSSAAGNTISAATGQVTYVAGWSGTSVIIVSAAGCYGPQTATHTVTITPTVGTPVFALGSTTTRCQGAALVTYSASATTTTGITYSLNAASLSVGNTINAANGEVTYSASYSGTTIITANAAGCNGPRTSTHTVTVTASVGPATFTMGASSIRCQGSATVTYVATATTNTGIIYTLDNTSIAGGLSVNASTGAVSYVATWSGTSIITATASGCNGPTTATHTITTTPTVGVPVFDAATVSSRCQGAGTVNFTATATNATGITYLLDATSTGAGNSINSSTGVVTFVATWSGISTITASAAGCNGPRTASFVITTVATVGTPVFSLGTSSNRCHADNTVTYTATATTNTGITYSLDAASVGGGNSINTANGAVTYVNSWIGTSVITATATGCNGPKSASHTVTSNDDVTVPVFTLAATTVRCQGAGSVTYTATANNTTGIIYTLDNTSSAAGNTISAATGQVTYLAGWSGTSVVTATAGGCPTASSSVHTVTITPTVGIPVFATGATSVRCQVSATVTYSATATTNTGLTYLLDATSRGAGNTINPATGVVTYTNVYNGTSTITVVATGCNGPTSAFHTVTTNGLVGVPVFDLGSVSARCQASENIFYRANAANASGIVYSIDNASAAAGVSINASNGRISYSLLYTGTIYITATANGCSGPQTAVHTAYTGFVGTPVFAAGSTSVRCIGANSVTYNAGAANTTGITYSLNSAAISAGNTINPVTGQVTYVASWGGSTVITASAAGCNGPRNATHTVTINAIIGTPVFNLGATSTRCRLAGNGTYTASAANTTAITYSLDAASRSAGNIINAVTGVVTYTGSWFGTSVITVTATGCGGPKAAIHTVTINDNVGTPVFAAGSTFTRCQSSETLQFVATAYANQGIIYSIDLNSRNNGNNVVQITGEVILVNSWSGTTTLTATAAGCAGPKSANFTIVTTPFVTTPVFAAGSNSIKCQGAESIIYTATANYTTGISYKLDSASLSRGNTIDTLTGNVNFAALYTGSLVITASANGCSGPKVATHAVLVTSYINMPVFSMGASSGRCQGGATVTYAATATGDAVITYSLDNASRAAGNLINTASGAVTFNGGYNGTAVITVLATGCGGPFSATHTVNITPTVGDPVFAVGTTSSRCRGAGSNTYTATSTNSTGLTYSLDGASISGGNTINATTGFVTFAANWAGSSTITATSTGCNGPDFSTHVVFTRADVSTPVFTLGSTSGRCQGGGNVTYTATASNTTGITYTLDNNSLAAGNDIDAATGIVTYASGWVGTTIISAWAGGCNGPATANHTVTITPAAAAPVFILGGTSSRCNGPGSVTYTANAPTAITYSLDDASIAAGNTINSSTGAVIYATGWVGTTQISATASGCGTPVTVHYATNTSTIATPVFNAGSSATRCQGAGSATYAATATYSSGLSYSLDAASVAAGNTINTATGFVTFVASWTTNSTITATAAGCNGPKSSSLVIATTGNGTPTFALGATSTRTQGVETVTYTATANNGASVSYSLDAASLSAGNNINATTGAVTYTLSWSGVSVITARANGCNGTSSATHTVTNAPSSVFKHLYLSDPAQALDRMDPVATLDATTASTATITGGGSLSFTQAPTLCSQLTVKIGRNITITAYATVTVGTMPANPAITAVLRYGSTNIISIANPTYNSSTGLLTWVGMLPADVTVPAGQAIALVITSAQTGVTFRIDYDSQTKPSKVELPVSTYISVESLGVYDAAYPGGTLITGGVSGGTRYIRAVVSDPFGFSDITGLTVTLTPPGNTVTATPVATAGCTRTYEYVWATPAGASSVNIKGIAKEGFENLVTASSEIAYLNCADCPPVPVNDSATGAGGAPLIMNVLANDTDPNNNINPLSLTIVTQPQNGNAIVSNGRIVYLPNGTFSGTDEFTYRVCDLTSPTPLCATAIGKVNIDPTIVDPCASASITNTYYIPYPETDARQALIKSTAAAFLPIPSNNIRTIISIKIPYNSMVVRWDHWEDGYEADILNPSQTSTLVWGDGNPYNGVAPGYPSDIIPAGGSIVLDNTMPSFPRVASNIFYDGRDKIVSSGEITLTQVSGEPSIISVQVMKTNVTSVSDFGTSFTIPAGEDFNSQDFRYSALFIRASQSNTEVNIDKDANGAFDTTIVLNEGQSYLVDGGVRTGATVTGTKPIGVDLHFGGVDGYSSREIPIFPATWYSNVYFTPVPTTKLPDTAVVMLYNNLNRPININWTYGGTPSSGTITLPAKQAVRYPLALSATNTYKFVNPTGESFTAIEIVDSYTPGGGGNSGSTFDWAFNMIASERLTTFATIAWAPGSTNGTRNDNPIWVTPATNTIIYVKYNGSVLTGGIVSPCGFRYDVAYPLTALKYLKVLDNNDRDQSGIAIYTCDGTKIAAVYGEDPSTALDANPSWDVGTTIKPYCAQKLLFANDDIAYTLTDRAVTIQVLNNDAGFSAVIDPATLSIGGLLRPKNGTVSVNANGTLLYTPNASFVGNDTLQYSVCSTPIPVCDFATVIVTINGCPAPGNQNVISGMVFSDVNKNGLNDDGKVGFPGSKVYFYTDGNCNGLIDANELKDTTTVDSSGGYQFITYPERTIADNFDNADGTVSCAAGTDGNTSWATNWVDAGDASVGFCVTPAQSYANTDAELIKDGSFTNALRLKDRNKSASRTFNISGATAAFISFKYRKAKTSLAAGDDIYVQASINGSSYGTLFTISGNGLVDLSYVEVNNLNILPYAGTNTIIRFLTNDILTDVDEVFIDDIKITYLKYPICYITAIDQSSLSTDFYFSTSTKNNFNVTNGGVCLYPYDFGIARKIITVSGNLYNDVNGLTDNLVNGLGTSGPAGNTMYAYLVSATTGKILFKTTINGLTGAYSFTRAEVSTSYLVVLTTTDAAVGATAPVGANLPTGYVAVGDSYGTANQAGTGNQPGTPDLSIPVNSGLFDVIRVNFGIQQRPTAGNGTNQAINPGGTLTVTVPASTFSNIAVSTDLAPGIISSIRIVAFPTNATTIAINGVSYTAATFPAVGVTVPATTTGQPTQTILVDPMNGMIKVTIPFVAIDNAGVESTVAGSAVLQMLIDTDKDGAADNIDIDDDNDGIPDVIEICYNGATSFSCAPGGIDPGLDSDNDGVVNWQDPDYGALNAAGCTAVLDRDIDGIPDHLDRDSDNDGIPDVVEAYGADADGDGVINNFTDTDGDGLSQNIDNNNTGAPGSGNGLGFQDLDGDGLSNTLDLDSDNDGIPDITEVQHADTNKDGRIDSYVDSDGDGYADAIDGDANNDFIIENASGPALKTGAALSTGKPISYPFKNPDQTGRPNPYDLDSDGDGVTDIVESGLAARVGISNGQASGGRTNGWANSVGALASLNIRNSDSRGPEDYLDIDSDDDGVTDNIEAQSTNGYVVPTDADTDADGLANVYDISTSTYGGNGLTPYDNDGDGTPDYLDLDSDNDGAFDLNEGSRYFNLTQANINSVDIDGDGLLDEFDTMNMLLLTTGSFFRNMTNGNMGTSGSFSGPLPSGSNTKLVKSDAKMTDRDWRNIVVLPIQIMAFNGTYLNNVVTLQWTVQNESEVNRYEMERSTNGIEFVKIGTVNARNLDNVEYSYKDDISTLSVVNIYYRVRQVSKNGQSYLTNVIKWKIEANKQQPQLYPNPVQDDLKIKFFAIDNQVAEVMVLDGGGRSVLTTRFTMIRGQNILTLPNVGRLNKGMYYLRFHSGLDTWMLKFMVQ